MSVTTDDLIELIEFAESALDAMRDSRKEFDLNDLYMNTMNALAVCWKEQGKQFAKEFAKWKSEFSEAPTKTKITRAWERSIEKATEKLTKELQQEISKALSKGAASAVDDIGLAGTMGVGLDVWDSRFWVRERVFEMTELINQTSRNRINSLITRLDDAGFSHAKIGKAVNTEIRSWYTEGLKENRAQLISYTEIGAGYEQGRLMIAEAYEKEGVLLEKRWIAIADATICSVCEAAVVDDWIPRQVLFANGFPQPLAHPGCRCDMALRVSPDYEKIEKSRPGAGVKSFQSLDDAMKYKWKGQPTSHNMYKSSKVRDVLNYYVDEGADVLNTFLRSGKPLEQFKIRRYDFIDDLADDVDWDDFDFMDELIDGRFLFDDLDSAFNMGAPTKEDLILWRGLDAEPKKLLKLLGKDPTKWEGKSFLDEAYTSSSLAKDEALDFASQGYLFKIITPKGTKLVTGLQWEGEYILARGTKYQIVEVKEVKDAWWNRRGGKSWEIVMKIVKK